MNTATSETAGSGHKRLDNIDGLRALAVAMVVLFHYTAHYPLDYVFYNNDVWHATYGRRGVELFFIVSGFCIYMTALHCRDRAQFWARRISRLWPAYVAAIMLTFVAVSIFGLPDREVSVLEALGNVFWLNAFHLARDVDGVYWSLIAELKLYLVFGMVFFLLRNRANLVFWWTLLCLAGGAVWIVDNLFFEGLIGRYSWSLATFVFPASGFFLMGMLIYCWDQTSWGTRIFAILVFLVSCLLITEDIIEFIVFFGMFLVAKIILGWTTLRVPAPIRFIGFVSYPLYLVHNNVGLVVLRETAPFVQSEYLRIAIAIGMSILLATLISVLVEHRFRKQIERPLERLFTALSTLGERAGPRRAISGNRATEGADSVPDR